MSDASGSPAFSRGALVYDVSEPPIVGQGVEYLEADVDDGYCSNIKAIHCDDEGDEAFTEMLHTLAETEFDRAGVARVISQLTPAQAQDWRIGESIACAFLTDERSCVFPWPLNRDEKNPRGVLPGTDHVGFTEDEQGWLFAFAEVKTSAESSSPPSVLNGRTGAVNQLLNLLPEENGASDLVKYLFFRASESTWFDRYKAATTRYLRSGKDMALFAVMVRPIKPNRDDLRSRVSSLAARLSRPPSCELFALYVPESVFRNIARLWST